MPACSTCSVAVRVTVSHAGKAAGAGVNMLYAGLKFTGLALSVAGGLAKAVRQDAERMVKELEADAAAKVSPCDELLPPLHVLCTWVAGKSIPDVWELLTLLQPM